MFKMRQVLLAALLVCWVSAIGQAQIFKQVPANAMIVVKVANLQATSKKVADFATTLGLAQMQPDFADPLAALEETTGISAGLDKTGEAALIYVDRGAAGGNPDDSIMLLIPVTDYKAFLGNIADAATDGDITTGHFKNDADIKYVANWGNYAVLAQVKELVAKKPEGLTPTGATVKEVAGKDFVVYVNFNSVGPKLTTEIEKGRTQAINALGKFVTQANDPKVATEITPYLAVSKVALNQVMNVASGFVADANGAVLSVNIGAPGIAITEMADFKPDSYTGKLVSQIKNTPNSLLTGLPDGKYILYGGSTSDPKLTTKIMGDFLDPITAELDKVQGPFGKPIEKMVDVIKTAGAANTGETFGVLVPTGQLGNDPLLQALGIRTGDAKVLVAAAKNAIDAQQELMQAIGGPVAQSSKSTYTANAKTVDGVSFNSIHTDFEMNPATPQAAQMSMFMTYMYGPNGMDALAGMVDDKTYLGAIGVNDKTISATLAAIKTHDDPLARTEAVKTVAGQLPPQRVAVVYFALDQLANVGLSTAKQMGIDMGVKLPDNLPPIGVTISSAGSAIVIDTYVPATLVQALTSAGMQIAMKRGGGGPGL